MTMMNLHFATGDTLWISGWAPTSGGAVFGACVGLFLLSALYRLVLVILHQVNLAFGLRSVEALERSYAQLLAQDSNGSRTPEEESSDEKTAAVRLERKARLLRQKRQIKAAPPFVWNHELLRGTIATFAVAIGYLLMLAVMTGNLYYIFAILAGAFGGEVLFGRYGVISSH